MWTMRALIYEQIEIDNLDSTFLATFSNQNLHSLRTHRITILDLEYLINPLRPNNDLSQTSHSNIKGVSVSEVMRIENEITPVKLY